jgi:xanthine/CO dehydrogenase XdhC/CoxF family maturation factor
MPRSSIELLTESFYAWEKRGRGWQLWPVPVELEPPFRPFYFPQAAAPAVSLDDGRRPTLLSRLTDRILGGVENSENGSSHEEFFEPQPEPWGGPEELRQLLVAVPADLDVPREAAEQFLLALPTASGPIAFELFGRAGSVQVLLSGSAADEPSVSQALKAYFPDVLVSRGRDALATAWTQPSPKAVVADFGLSHEFMVPLRLLKKFDVDPLAGIVGALSELGPGEAGLFQVLVRRARQPWAREVLRAVLDERGSPFFIDAPEISALARVKVARPLFACVVRIGVKAESREKSLAVVRRMSGALSALADPLANELIPLQGYRSEDHQTDLLLRRSRRSGMLLSIEELVSLVHLPTSSIRNPALVRHGKKTRSAPSMMERSGVALGQNVHDGKAIEVKLSSEHRSRHMYVIGASGTGKSTLLLNLIRQDLENGEGLALFDPHGDLVDRVLGLVPERRTKDVVLIDPSDSEFPIGFNILSAASDLEKILLASDLVTVFQRLSMSWGDQMTSVLGNAVLAFLESEQGGTIVDLKRFLVEDRFRKEFLKTVRDPDVVYFWEREFPLLRGRPQAPILTRLDTFLRPKPIRYMVAQKDSALDLRAVMDEGKVLLCRLSHGAIGEENAHLLGSLLVSKFHQMAMSRQDVAEEKRRPFHLYIDEFHHFVTPSMAQILSGARKYRLSLVLAHQDLRQLQSRSSDVLSSVLTNPATRVCFRVGDDDARLLAKGFSSFDASDLQNLGTGEAIVRVERSEWDFNLRTASLPALDETLAEERRAQVVAETRRRYARPRTELEALLQVDRGEEVAAAAAPVEERTGVSKSRPVRSPTPVVGVATLAGKEGIEIPATPSTPGRGGQEHKYLQGLIRKWAESNGWGATVEESVLDDLGRIDVALRKDGVSVACEIVVSSPAEHEAENIQKCLAAGFAFVVVISSEKRRLGHIRTLAKEGLSAEQFARVHLVSPQEVFDLLGGLHHLAPKAEPTVRGYRVRVRMQPGKADEQQAKHGAVSAVIAKALRRMKKPSTK